MNQEGQVFGNRSGHGPAMAGLAGPGAMALAYATKLGVMSGGTLQTRLMYASHCAGSVYCMRGIACCEYTRESTHVAGICLSFK